MELLLILVYRQKQLTNITEYQILNAVGELDLPLQLIWNSKGTERVGNKTLYRKFSCNSVNKKCSKSRVIAYYEAPILQKRCYKRVMVCWLYQDMTHNIWDNIR